MKLLKADFSIIGLRVDKKKQNTYADVRKNFYGSKYQQQKLHSPRNKQERLEWEYE